MADAEKWLSNNILKNYWIKEADGASKFPLKIESKNSAAYLMKKVEQMQHQRGIPVDMTLKVSKAVDVNCNIFHTIMSILFTLLKAD